MKTRLYKLLIFGLVLTMGVWYFEPAKAETSVATGAAASSGGAGASVNLDFEIIIPQFIVFRVGSAAAIDTIQFSPTAADVAAGTAGTAGTGGDLGNGVVTVSLLSNAGAITITPSNNSGGSGLGNGSGDFISYAQIITANTGADPIPPPTLSDAGGTASPVAPNIGVNVTDLTTQWTYTYNNPATPPSPGTYGGAANGGRVTYTAAIP